MLAVERLTKPPPPPQVCAYDNFLLNEYDDDDDGDDGDDGQKYKDWTMTYKRLADTLVKNV